MTDFKLTSDPRVATKLSSYPEHVKPRLQRIRSLILEVAQEHPEVTRLEETLKWGEPSYLTRFGSTLRMDWKTKAPDQYALYFKCTSKLVNTFRQVYGDLFSYEGTRAIVFSLNDPLPEPELKNCIRAALRYHKVKHLPNLDM